MHVHNKCAFVLFTGHTKNAYMYVYLATISLRQLFFNIYMYHNIRLGGKMLPSFIKFTYFVGTWSFLG